MSNFIDFLLVISKLQSPIYCPSPQEERGGSRSLSLNKVFAREEQRGGGTTTVTAVLQEERKASGRRQKGRTGL